jgi:hypothetical protein
MTVLLTRRTGLSQERTPHRRRQPLVTHRIFPLNPAILASWLPAVAARPHVRGAFCLTHAEPAPGIGPLSQLPATIFEQGRDTGGKHRHRAEQDERSPASTSERITELEAGNAQLGKSITDLQARLDRLERGNQEEPSTGITGQERGAALQDYALPFRDIQIATGIVLL